MKKSNQEKIKELENDIRESKAQMTILAKRMKNMGVLYAKRGDKDLTIYIVNELKANREYAQAMNIPHSEKLMNEALDEIEAIMDTW